MRFVDRGYASIVGLVQLVKAAKLSGTQGQVPACVREALGFKAKYKGERDWLDHLRKRGHLVPLEQRWHLRQRGGNEEVAVLVWERVLSHEKVFSFCLGMGERRYVGKLRRGVTPLSSGVCSVRYSCDFHFSGLLFSVIALKSWCNITYELMLFISYRMRIFKTSIFHSSLVESRKRHSLLPLQQEDWWSKKSLMGRVWLGLWCCVQTWSQFHS